MLIRVLFATLSLVLSGCAVGWVSGGSECDIKGLAIGRASIRTACGVPGSKRIVRSPNSSSSLGKCKVTNFRCTEEDSNCIDSQSHIVAGCSITENNIVTETEEISEQYAEIVGGPSGSKWFEVLIEAAIAVAGYFGFAGI